MPTPIRPLSVACLHAKSIFADPDPTAAWVPFTDTSFDTNDPDTFLTFDFSTIIIARTGLYKVDCAMQNWYVDSGVVGFGAAVSPSNYGRDVLQASSRDVKIGPFGAYPDPYVDTWQTFHIFSVSAANVALTLQAKPGTAGLSWSSDASLTVYRLAANIFPGGFD
jgi:hypothetical protein